MFISAAIVIIMRLPSESEASALALSAIAWLARDARRLRGWLAASGLDAQALRAGLDDAGLQAGALEYLLGDESLLLTFVAEEGLAPDAPRLAWMRLRGGDGG